MKTERIILAGGGGFAGRLLARTFAGEGYEVVVLSRTRKTLPNAARTTLWDGRSLGRWAEELEGARAVINLSGRSVNCRYNRKNRKLILDSRVESTRVLGEAIRQCARPPAVWLNAGTATIYKHSFERELDEMGEIGGTRDAKDEFSVEVAQAWEAAFDGAQTPGTRHVTMRMAMIFGAEEGGVFRVLRRLARLGLGGSMGGGRQYVSWIHEADFCRTVQWLVNHDEFSGAVNLVAPNPLTNREMMRAFRATMGAPLGLPATRWMLEIGAFLLRTETELMIKSRRVVPARLLKAGFDFRYPRLEEALREIEARVAAG
jgi:uncharacterized protein (TIGR01777 family)